MNEANSRDPNREWDGEREWPRELLYAERLARWVKELNPQASETLLLAARCQHICRWEIPRETYPPTRAGYLKWREDLKRFHARKAGEILRQAGYEEGTIRRVQEMNLKLNLKSDPDTQTLEDALCLIFLEFQLADLTKRTEQEKLVNAVKKFWLKMSEAGRARALQLSYAATERAIIEKALERLPPADSTRGS